MSAGDGGCRSGTVKVPSPADTGRPAVILMLGRDGRLWRRPVRPSKISDGTVENTDLNPYAGLTGNLPVPTGI